MDELTNSSLYCPFKSIQIYQYLYNLIAHIKTRYITLTGDTVKIYLIDCQFEDRNNKFKLIMVYSFVLFVLLFLIATGILFLYHHCVNCKSVYQFNSKQKQQSRMNDRYNIPTSRRSIQVPALTYDNTLFHCHYVTRSYQERPPSYTCHDTNNNLSSLVISRRCDASI